MSSPAKKSTPVTLPSHSSTSTPDIHEGVTPRKLPLHLTDACVLKQRDLDDLSPTTATSPPPGFRATFASKLDDFQDQPIIPEGDSLEIGHTEEKGESLRTPKQSPQNGLTRKIAEEGTHYEQTMAEVKKETEVRAARERNGGLTTMASAKKLTRNQTFRLKKFGTVMPVSGGEDASKKVAEASHELRGPDTTSPDQELMRSISKNFNAKGRVKRLSTFKRVVHKVGKMKRMLGAMGLRTKDSQDDSNENQEDKHKRAWEALLNDHLEGADSQLRRYLRWQEDYRYFLKTQRDYDEVSSLSVRLSKRGTCRCPLSKQNCGPMDPYLYTVHCPRCSNLLPPFADQMVCMVTAIGQPDSVVAHRNAIGLEMEEERDMLMIQEVFIEQLDEDRQNIAEGRSVLGARRHHHHHGGSVHEGGGGRMSGGRASGGRASGGGRQGGGRASGR
ncbi:hypothetical protein TrVE_jg11158 [Triparma verrucosa]|uniref:Uncharacterized protein n=1 Tax=Triparma verrucosa TaxID=1606542 RepID=A0A9W7CKK3_9STRA|nr:hypothetical protein TrVE_jg11158 [Triparma verrucosa]